MFQKKNRPIFLLFLSCLLAFSFADFHQLNSNSKTFNYTYDCSYLFSGSHCNLLNLSFANDVFSNSPETDLENLNKFIEDSYIFKKKFALRKESNDSSKSDYTMILSDDLVANDTVAVFFSQEEVLSSKSLGRSYMKSFPEVDLHSDYQKLDLPSNELDFTLVLLYHLYHISYSKFANDLRLLPREIRLPAISLSEYEVNLLEENSLAHNVTMQIRRLMPVVYQTITQEMKNKWSRQEIVSFLNGREVIPPQDFVYAWLIVQGKSWLSFYEKIRFFYFAPVFMHVKYADNFHINQTRIYRYLTGRDLFSTKIVSRYDQKEMDNLSNDMFEAKTENFLLLHSFIPKRNDFDCINIRILPEYVAKDWMRDSTGEECFDRVLNSTIINFHIVALHMNMDEEEKTKCEMILQKFADADVERKQQLVIKKCPFSGYKLVDMWNKAFTEIDEELKPELKEKLKKTKEYIKLRKELGLDTTNGELIKKLWEGKISLIEDVKKKMNSYREMSLKKIKSSQEAEKMSFEKPFVENKIEL